MDHLISQLNEILRSWQTSYDIFSCVPLVFTVNGDKHLFLNRTHLCPATSLELTCAAYDAQHLRFDFRDASRILVTITWPEDGTPFVSDINFTAARDMTNK